MKREILEQKSKLLISKRKMPWKMRVDIWLIFILVFFNYREMKYFLLAWIQKKSLMKINVMFSHCAYFFFWLIMPLESKNSILNILACIKEVLSLRNILVLGGICSMQLMCLNPWPVFIKVTFFKNVFLFTNILKLCKKPSKIIYVYNT